MIKLEKYDYNCLIHTINYVDVHLVWQGEYTPHPHNLGMSLSILTNQMPRRVFAH
jgi:hypothetical protein